VNQRWRRTLSALLVVLLASVVAVPADASPSKINGSGSTYVALAMQQWVADAQSSGLQVNYLPTGSPQGLSQFADSLIDFAGTEAEYSALGYGNGVRRGYQYVPDVAGAVAIMYNVEDLAGRKVDYLHLSRETVARIFIGEISRWSDPAISADNKGLTLPDQPITVVYRGGQSGTTALFYDFVQNTAPANFDAWAKKYNLPTQVRIIQLDGTPEFAPKTAALQGSDQIAQYVASNAGKWAIAYDEFGYAVTYGAPAAWIQNASGNWVLPYAQNISAALEAAQLRPDLSQDLRGVYASTNSEAYPISAYSYMVTQCAPTADRETCQGPYANAGVAETLSQWMRYIACDGQVNMARIGYSPLPQNLSQEIVNSIGRMNGTAPEQLSAGNCANPRFQGSLGGGATSPTDPLQQVSSLGGGDATGSAAAGTSSTGSDSAASGAEVAAGPSVAAGSTKAVGGGSTKWRNARPVIYDRPTPGTPGSSALVLLLLAVATPLLLPKRRPQADRR
jgi:phosphate transport system substrate-binding protein